MIYEFPAADDPIRQGDIFFPLPYVAVSLDNVPVLGAESIPERKNWEEFGETTEAIFSVSKVWGIVASQDCDTVRAPQISLFRAQLLSDIDKSERSSVKAWVKWITKKTRENAKLFYLPADERIGFPDRMLVLFEDVIQVPRESLEIRRGTHRKGRLNYVADEHYRESIAQFFRRYPYNEWYPLNKPEFTQYSADSDEVIPPYDWQK